MRTPQSPLYGAGACQAPESGNARTQSTTTKSANMLNCPEYQKHRLAKKKATDFPEPGGQVVICWCRVATVSRSRSSHGEAMVSKPYSSARRSGDK
ncbi:hypothetical protein GGTG_12241 [Gaeumannomyces tritici R3-111a-1]|uniref:Uncharacterized protein n=1 Tax=Gaeumannomyces tritici (strain R3-111a-1) TaxID=644352 RepID=J3PFG6_GAET3|nr:hypothetical protein GGTG_12241 [Gaeumannomyces tritici R3-111a-1]EJT70068.1 hypothetical protein GGTG_12241 [Gaeumannomyces tritici R3-111a-1]